MNNKFGISLLKGFSADKETIIAEIARVGFQSSFFSWNDGEDHGATMKLFEKHGIEVDNIHAPFSKLNCIWREGPDGDEYTDRLIRCVDDAAALHIPNVVMHPVSGESFPSSSLIGIERFRRIVDHACSNGVKVCFENVEYSEMLGIVMSEFGNAVGFCYDTGHEHTNDPGMRFVKMFGDRLTCTHIHDNYGLSYIVYPILHGDCHMIPLDADIDFRQVMRDIRSVDYKGVLMLECSRHGLLHTYEKYTLGQYLERAYNALSEIASYED